MRADDASPGRGRAGVTFTPQWAAAQRDVHNFEALRRSVGTAGAVVSQERVGTVRRTTYEWLDATGAGRLRVYAYPDGAFAAVVSPARADGDITFNSFGAFVCPACEPPVNACGVRPSWVPHDLHWDNFDCTHTLTGPQSLDFDHPS